MSAKDQDAEQREAEIIRLCAKFAALWHEQVVIAIGDEWAPDKGPLHSRYEAILAKQHAVARRLYALGHPLTQGGAAAMAHAAVVHWPRSRGGTLFCETISQWLAMAAIQRTARTAAPTAAYGSLIHYIDTEAEEAGA